MAHKKAGGSTQLGRDSVSKRLGVKLFEGQYAKNGAIIIRQRGSKFRPGPGVMKGGDDTLFASMDGIVHFSNKKIRKFHGHLERANFVSVVAEAPEAKEAKVAKAAVTAQKKVARKAAKKA
jgi:large subunit ribosomal protein L27